MATYRIKAPDGAEWDVQAPEGASQADVLAYARKQWAQRPPAQQAAPPSFLSELGREVQDSLPGQVARGLGRAARDVIDAPALWAAKGADALGLTRGEAQRVSDINHRAEAAYQAATPGSFGAGMGRAAGNIASAFLPGTGQTAAGGRIAAAWQAGGLPQRIAALLGAGGLGAAQAVTLGARTLDDDPAALAALGASLGAGGQLAGAAVGRGAQLFREARDAPARAGRILSTAAEMTPEELAARITSGNRQLLQGSVPTTTQAAMVPGVSRLQASTRAYAPGRLTAAEEAQNAARVAALEGMAPGARGRTSFEAAQNAGDILEQEAAALGGNLKGIRNTQYASPALADATVGLPTREAALAAVKEYYPGVAYRTAPDDLRSAAWRLSGGEPVPFKEFDALRKLAGNRARDLAESDRTASAAWGSIKRLLDDTEGTAAAAGTAGPRPPAAAGPANIEAAFRAFDSSLGPQGAVPGYMSPEAAAALRAGRGAHADWERRFNTGPAALLQRTGSDNAPRVQGAEAIKAFVNAKDSQVADIAQLRRIIEDRGPTLQAARGYAVSDALDAATQRGADANVAQLLPGRLDAWADRRSGMLRGLFDGQDLATLGAVREDANRAARAADLGKARGESNTAEKLTGQGLFESPWLDRGLGLLPRWLGKDLARAALDATRDAGRRRAAQDMAGRLVDPEEALRALRAYEGLMQPDAFQLGLGRFGAQGGAPLGLAFGQ